VNAQPAVVLAHQLWLRLRLATIELYSWEAQVVLHRG
jgi:hypothetical protein